MRFHASRRHRLFIELVRILRGFRSVEAVQAPQLEGDVFIDRAGVRLLLGDAELRKPLENLVSLHFQFARQLVDANLLHR
jgi:hypothetical protein